MIPGCRRACPSVHPNAPVQSSERGGLIERVPGLRLCVDTAIIISSRTPSFGSRPRVLARLKQTREASNERGVVGKPGPKLQLCQGLPFRLSCSTRTDNNSLSHGAAVEKPFVFLALKVESWTAVDCALKKKAHALMGWGGGGGWAQLQCLPNRLG